MLAIRFRAVLQRLQELRASRNWAASRHLLVRSQSIFLSPHRSKAAMPEGPSIVILCEEVAAFTGKTVERAEGNSKLDKSRLVGQTVRSFRSWASTS